MLKHIIAPALLALAIAAPAAAEQRPLANFDAVEAAGGVSVEIFPGQQFSVDVSGPHADRIVTEVRDHVLHVRLQNSGWFNFNVGRQGTVRVTMPSVRAIDSAAGADVNAHDVRGDALRIYASSGSSLDINGVCRSLRARVDSGADIDAQSLQCDAVDVGASSGGGVHVNSRVSADVAASSGGDVYLTGEGRVGDVSLSSGGNLHHR